MLWEQIGKQLLANQTDTDSRKEVDNNKIENQQESTRISIGDWYSNTKRQERQKEGIREIRELEPRTEKGTKKSVENEVVPSSSSDNWSTRNCDP